MASHTLATLSRVSLFTRIVVAVAPDDVRWDELARGLSARIEACEGGAERWQSVRNAMMHLAPVARPDDWVLVHDIARPCVRVSDIERLIARLKDHPVGGLLAVPVRDTMKRASPEGEVETTVARERLWHALTPQMFRYGLLLQALRAGEQSGLVMTDESSAMEALGLKPQLVEGSADNIKVTHPQDLPLAALFLQQQAASQ